MFPNQPGGWRILKTPTLLKVLCDPAPEDPTYNPLPEERPGGFDWGNRAQEGDGEEAEEEEDERGRGNDDDGHHPHRD